MGTMTGVRLPIRIRFVGGCWHNMLPEMKTLPPIVSSSDEVHVYHLAEFYTKAGTAYYQYIHKSLIKGDRVSLSTCRERMPRWTLNQVELENQVRRAIQQAYKQN